MKKKESVNPHIYPKTPDGYRAEIIRLGYGSMRRWAMAHGHHPRTVGTVLERWASRDQTPRGGKAEAIWHDLRATLRQGRKSVRTAKTPNMFGVEKT